MGASGKIGFNNPQIEQAMQVGDVSGGNYSDFRENGTMRRVGDATAWKDIIGDIFGKTLASVAGKVDYDFDENALKFQSGGSITTTNDRVGSNLEINHELKVGTDILFKPHIHRRQQVTTGTVEDYVFTMRYKIQRNNYAKVTAWTTVTCDTGAGGDDVFDFTGKSDGLYNQISRFPDIIATVSVSDTIQFQMTRTDSVGTDVRVYFMDMHAMVDSDGSDEEITKAP